MRVVVHAVNVGLALQGLSGANIIGAESTAQIAWPCQEKVTLETPFSFSAVRTVLPFGEVGCETTHEQLDAVGPLSDTEAQKNEGQSINVEHLLQLFQRPQVEKWSKAPLPSVTASVPQLFLILRERQSDITMLLSMVPDLNRLSKYYGWELIGLSAGFSAEETTKFGFDFPIGVGTQGLSRLPIKHEPAFVLVKPYATDWEYRRISATDSSILQAFLAACKTEAGPYPCLETIEAKGIGDGAVFSRSAGKVLNQDFRAPLLFSAALVGLLDGDDLKASAKMVQLLDKALRDSALQVIGLMSVKAADPHKLIERFRPKFPVVVSRTWQQELEGHPGSDLFIITPCQPKKHWSLQLKEGAVAMAWLTKQVSCLDRERFQRP